MKKIICVALALLLFALATGCGKSKTDGIIVKKGGEFSQSDERDSQMNATESTDPTQAEKTVLNPFDGISFETSGISPRCTVTVNNANCSVDVQKKVTYTLDKEFYANGETAVIMAALTGYNDNQLYSLSSETTQWKVENQPEYITSVDDIDLSQIKPELEDFVKATAAKETHEVIGRLFGAEVAADEVKDLKAGDIYFQSIKLQKEVEDDLFYNYLTFCYSGKYIAHYSTDEDGNIYTCISAVNLIKYPDGTIKWGSESTDGFDFKAEGSTKGMEDCIDKAVIIHSDNYNITKLDKNS